MTGIRHEEEHAIEPTIPALEGDLPLEGLDVPETSLGLDRDGPARTVDQEVPGPPIAQQAERDLRPASEARKERREAGQKAQLSGISDPVPLRWRPGFRRPRAALARAQSD